MEKIILMIKGVIAVLMPQLKSANPVHGIKELKEALIASLEIGLFVFKRLKDGVGMDDAAAVYDKLVNDEDFKAVVVKGYEDAKKIPEEVKDIDAAEALELVDATIDYVPRFLEK